MVAARQPAFGVNGPETKDVHESGHRNPDVRVAAPPKGFRQRDRHVRPHNPGELPRLLTSLQKVRGIGQIIVLVAAEPAISDQAAEKVQDIVSRFPSLNIAIIGADECNLVQQRMEQLGLGKLSKEIGLTGYGAIRNLGLVLANVMGFDSIVFLDDDEVIDDADFLQKGVYGLGKLTRKGVPILAKTGYYLNSEGSYLSKSQDKWYNRFWQQGKAFNKCRAATMCAAAAWPFTRRRSNACRSIRGSLAARTWTTC